MQFTVSFDAANSPDLAGLTTAEQQAVLDTTNAAALVWSWYLTAANITLDLRIVVDDSQFSGNVLAQGGPRYRYFKTDPTERCPGVASMPSLLDEIGMGGRQCASPSRCPPIVPRF